MDAHRIEMARDYRHPIARVWKAISTADEISKWFIQADFIARTGYAYTFVHEGTTITGEVLDVAEPHRLVYTWVISGTAARTVVEWHLKELDDGGTRLTIIHEGFENFADAAPNMIKASTTGWQAVFSELEGFLDG